MYCFCLVFCALNSSLERVEDGRGEVLAKNEMAKTIVGMGDASLSARGAVRRHTEGGYQERLAMVHGRCVVFQVTILRPHPEALCGD